VRAVKGIEVEQHGTVRFASGDWVWTGTANRVVEVDGKITKIYPKRMKLVRISANNTGSNFSEIVAP